MPFTVYVIIMTNVLILHQNASMMKDRGMVWYGIVEFNVPLDTI